MFAQHPVTGLPMAKKFQKTVAMDLLSYKGHVSQHHHSFLTKNQKHIQDSDICIWICGQTFVRFQWWI